MRDVLLASDRRPHAAATAFMGRLADTADRRPCAKNAPLKAAVRVGKATNTLLEMLEDAERRKQALKGGREAPPPPVMQARLEKVLAELPERVQAYLKDLETFLTEEHVAEGRSILAALHTQILIRSNGTAEIGGDLRAALKLIVPKRDGESVFRWLGIIRDLRTALQKNPLPLDELKELLGKAA